MRSEEQVIGQSENVGSKQALPCHYAFFRETVTYWGYRIESILQHYGVERLHDLFTTVGEMERLLKEIRHHLRPDRFKDLDKEEVSQDAAERTDI